MDNFESWKEVPRLHHKKGNLSNHDCESRLCFRRKVTSLCLFSQEDGGCGYFKWIDPEMCYRSKQIIPGLLRRKNMLESENAGLRSQIFKLKMALFVVIVIVVVFYML